MTETVRRVGYWYTEVPDQPGEGSRVLAAVRDWGADLLAFSGFPTNAGMAQLDFVPVDPDAFLRAVEPLDLDFSERKEALLVQGDERVGAAADVVARLAREDVNLIASQAVSSGAGRYGMILWVAPGDVDRAALVLGA